jgi:MAD (mothers against decapentaplegic) interacting protein
MLLRNLKVFVRIVDRKSFIFHLYAADFNYFIFILLSLVSFSNLSKCWLFVTSGLCVNAQDELVFILKCNLDESMNVNETKVPRQILYHIMDVFDKSSKGFRVGPMNHILYDFESAKLVADIFNTNIKTIKRKNSLLNGSVGGSMTLDDSALLLDNRENAGFLYFRPNVFHYRSLLKKIAHHLPNEPFLIGYLIHRWEIPFAKLFPLRLYLRLGEQFDCKLYLILKIK